jgi:GT2 family glycosyltransferase
MPTVSVVIPHLRGTDLLPRCLRSLEEQTGQVFETILVDDGAVDGSVAAAAGLFPWARVVVNVGPHGFAGACNAGIRASGGDWVWLLNDDARAAPGCLEALLEAVRRQPAAGSITPKMLRAAPPHLVDNCGIGFSVWGAGYQIAAGRPDDSATELVAVFGASGGAGLFRREMLESLGGFDESFGSNNEDVDLAFRAQLAGYRCWCAPRAVVLHAGSVTAGAGSPGVTYLVMRNQEFVFWKNMPAPLLAVYGLPHLVYGLAWLAVWMARGQGRVAWRGKVDALRAWRAILGERKSAQSRRRISLRAVVALISWRLAGRSGRWGRHEGDAVHA